MSDALTPAPDARRQHTRQIAAEIVLERDRQVDREGYLPEHDDAHDHGELARAGAAYAFQAGFYGNTIRADDERAYRATKPIGVWPATWQWKPKDQRSDLVRAAALILAEIERLDRKSGRP